MLTDYLYIVIFILLIWYSYDKIVNKTIANYDQPVILELENTIVKATLIDSIKHLNSLKQLLTALNKYDYAKLKGVGSDTIITIRRMVNQCVNDLNVFKQANNFDNDDLWNDSEFVDLHIMQKIYESEYTRSDTDSNHESVKFTKLIIDLEIVIDILQDNKTNGRLILTNLYKLIDFLPTLLPQKEHTSYFDANKEENIYFSIPEKSTNEDNLYINTLTNDYGRVGKMPTAPTVIKVNKSQDVDNGYDRLPMDGERFVNDNHGILLSKILPDRYTVQESRKNGLNTQHFSASLKTHNTKRNTIPDYIPFADLNKLKEDKARISNVIYDQITAQALRNDYNLN